MIQQWAYWGGLNQQWSISPYANPVSVQPYTPAPAGIPLFNNGAPSYLDVEQGQVGDCWLLASLAEVAARDPQIITSMFRYDGTTVDNEATVRAVHGRFYNTSGSAFTVNVDTELPWGGEWYDNLTSDMGTQSLWVALAEKAYAETSALGDVTTHFDGVDAYEAMNNGDPTWALSAITGKPASNFAVGTPSQVSSSLAADWKAGDLIALCTTKPSSSSIVSDHCYAVVGYNAASSEPFDFMNPWGSNSSGWAAPPGETSKILGQFWTNGIFISQNFTSVGTGSGAADVERREQGDRRADRAVLARRRLRPVGDDSLRPASARRPRGGRDDATRLSPARHGEPQRLGPLKAGAR